jgi:glycosyltransferase involved in cell wall biosynthesis
VWRGDEQTKSLKHEDIQIAWVEALRTLSGSGEIYRIKQGGHSPIEDQLSRIFEITFLRHPSISRYITPRRSLPLKLKFSFSIATYLLRQRPNLLITTGVPHVEGFVAFLIGTMQRKTVLLEETHWYWPSTFTSKLAWPLNLWMVRHARLLLVPGKRVKEYWEHVGVPAHKIKVVPFYVSVLNVNSRTMSLARDLREVYKGNIIILYLGRLLEKKGINYLLQAFQCLKREISESVLIIAGEGPERANLERLSRKMSLKDVQFTGAIDEKDKAGYFVSADIYVYPSITLETPEEWSLGIIEAMSVGKPIVATLATGCALDVIKNGVNGFIVPEKDSEALCQAIRTLAGNADLRKRMGTESKKIVEDVFNYSSAVDLFIQAINLGVK